MDKIGKNAEKTLYRNTKSKVFSKVSSCWMKNIQKIKSTFVLNLFLYLGFGVYVQFSYAAGGARPGVVGKSSHKVRSGGGAVSRVSSIARLTGGGRRSDSSGDKRQIAVHLLEDTNTKSLPDVEELSRGDIVLEDIQLIPVVRKNNALTEREVEDFLSVYNEVFSTTDFMYILGIEQLSEAVDILRSLEDHKKVVFVRQGFGVTSPSILVALDVLEALEAKHGITRERAKRFLIEDYEKKQEIIEKARDFISKQEDAFSDVRLATILKLQPGESGFALNYLAIRGEVVLLREGVSRADPGIWVDAELVKQLQISNRISKMEAKTKLLIAYYNERGWPLMLLEQRIRNAIHNQTGAFSFGELTYDLEINGSGKGIRQSINILNTLYRQGTIVLLQRGGEFDDVDVLVSPSGIEYRGTGIDSRNYDFDILVSREVLDTKKEKSLSESEAIDQLLDEYDIQLRKRRTKRQQTFMNLNTVTARVRHYISWQTEAFSTNDVTLDLGITPRQSSQTLSDLKSRGEVAVVDEGIRSNDSNVFVSPEVLKERKNQHISEAAAKRYLLREYIVRKSTDLKTIAEKIRNYISQQVEPFSTKDVTRALGITPEQSSNTLRDLKKQGDVILLRQGTSSKNNPGVWVNPVVMQVKLQNGMDITEAVDFLLSKYDTKPKQPRPSKSINLNTMTGRIRYYYIPYQLNAFTRNDVARALGITPKQSSKSLIGLKEQGHVILLRQGTGSKSNPNVWASAQAIKEKAKFFNENAKKRLLDEYEAKQLSIDLNTMTGEIRYYYILHQFDAFTHKDVAHALGIEPGQSNRLLRNLQTQGHVVLLRRGIRGDKNNPGVWANPQAIRQRAALYGMYGVDKARNELLSEYDARKLIDLDIMASRVRSYIHKQEGAFSTVDVTEDVGIRPEQSNSTLHNLKDQKEVVLLRQGTSGISNPNMWAGSQALQAKMEQGISRDKAIAILLHEYDTRPKLPKPIDLGKIVGRVRYYIYWQVGAFSSKDVSKVLGMAQQQSRSALNYLKEQGEVRLIDEANGRGSFNIWVSRGQFEALEARYGNKDTATGELLKAYYKKLETLSALQISVVSSTEQTNGTARSILQLDEQQAGFVTQALFALADMFPDGNFTHNQRDVFQDRISRHVGLGDAFLSLAEALNNQEVELSPRNAFALIWRASKIEDTEGVLVSKSLDFPGHVESLAVVELIYTIIAHGSVSVDSETLNDPIEPLNWLFEQWEMQAAGVN